MKYEPGESLDNWARRVKLYEQGHAMQRIAKGEDVEQVMADMSHRIVEKLLYPIISAIKESVVKQETERTPTEVSGEIPRAVADHVVDD